MITDDPIAKAIYAAYDDNNDPWDEATRRRKELGMGGPSNNQQRALKAAADVRAALYGAGDGGETKPVAWAYEWSPQEFEEWRRSVSLEDPRLGGFGRRYRNVQPVSALSHLPSGGEVKKDNGLDQSGRSFNPADRPGTAPVWHSPNDPPQLPPDSNVYRIVAVRRKHSGKVYSFPATYLQEVELYFSDDAQDRLTTGWFSSASDGDRGDLYVPLLNNGDELIAWTEVPQYEVSASPASLGGKS